MVGGDCPRADVGWADFTCLLSTCCFWADFVLSWFELISVLAVPGVSPSWYRLSWFRLFAVPMLFWADFSLGASWFWCLDVTNTLYIQIVNVNLRTALEMPLTALLQYKNHEFKRNKMVFGAWMRPGTVFCECICHVMVFFIMKRGICVHRTDVVTFELICVLGVSSSWFRFSELSWFPVPMCFRADFKSELICRLSWFGVPELIWVSSELISVELILTRRCPQNLKH